MVDIAHKNLTGGDLHEPKGITAAPANSAYVADGAGSGVWTPTASFPGAFGAKLFHIRDERPSGTDGDTLTVSTWNPRAINTEKADDLGLTASGNQLSLPAGTYWIEVEALTQFSGLVTNQLSSPTTKGGRAITSGEVEVYLDLKLWRTA
jgi:hypothetical protein